MGMWKIVTTALVFSIAGLGTTNSALSQSGQGQIVGQGAIQYPGKPRETFNFVRGPDGNVTTFQPGSASVNSAPLKLNGARRPAQPAPRPAQPQQPRR